MVSAPRCALSRNPRKPRLQQVVSGVAAAISNSNFTRSVVMVVAAILLLERRTRWHRGLGQYKERKEESSSKNLPVFMYVTLYLREFCFFQRNFFAGQIPLIADAPLVSGRLLLRLIFFSENIAENFRDTYKIFSRVSVGYTLRIGLG